MEDKIKDLLELFDKDLERKITPKELIDLDFSAEFLDDCHVQGLIRRFPETKTREGYNKMGSSGLFLLNGIRMKKSIDDFDKSSKESFDKLGNSINDFDKSSKKLSKWMIALTGTILGCTIIMVIKMICG